ncbi:MAG TPA: glycosyltransferase family 2 protein [Candidatus Binatia bacterium]|nr:glycosyltransferase family 2 protein [Candidatus Binatia bacterium]
MQPLAGRAGPPLVGVVVLDWNGGRETLDAVESVYASDHPALAVVLVDNASRAPVLEEAARSHPDLRTIANPRNLGYAGGNNAGIRAALDAGAEYVLVLNNDARVAPDAIARLVEVAERDPAIGAVGAKIVRADDPRRLWLAWGEVSYRQSLVRLVGAGELDGERFAEQSDVPWVSGAAILLARRALEAVGAFDEDFFAYHEEVDWCARARAQGFRIAWTPRAVVVHRGQGASGGPSYVGRRQYLTARNMVRFVARHGTPWQRAKFAVFLAATLPFQYLRRLASGEQEGVVQKVRGVRDALLGRPIPRSELDLD